MEQMKAFLTLLAVTLMLGGCGPKAPKLTFCVLDGENSVLICQAPDGHQYDVTIRDAHRFLCQPPQDAQKLRDYVISLERNCK